MVALNDPSLRVITDPSEITDDMEVWALKNSDPDPTKRNIAYRCDELRRHSRKTFGIHLWQSTAPFYSGLSKVLIDTIDTAKFPANPHFTVSANRITPLVSGLYMCTANIEMALVNTFALYEINIVTNTGTIAADASRRQTGGLGNAQSKNFSFPIQFGGAAGITWIELWAFIAGSRQLTNNANATYLSLTKIGNTL